MKIIHPTILLLVTLATGACTPERPKDTGQPEAGCTDADGDGFGVGDDLSRCTFAEPDCDDGDYHVNPVAYELCDGIDNDCDGVTDPGTALGASTWYADADGDGYGEAVSTTAACAAPSGYTDDATDCDDTRADVNPAAEESDCTDPTDYNCDGSVGWADDDGDGWAACEECDDSNAEINPDANEICDGIDNDCDGGTDEGVLSTWYADTDGDGYGDAANSIDACTAPSGYVADATDCDDAEPAANPGASETCDGLDNNCDGDTDEGVLSTWYADADRDGYGDAASTVAACAAPSGYVADATDCDDGNIAIHPEADEYCDTIDSDCNGTLDDDYALDAPTWYADTDGDAYGDPSTSVLACTQPTGYLSDATDCDDGNAAIHPEADEYCDTIDSDCDGTPDEADSLDATTWYADTDVDGYGDAASFTTACTVPSGYVADATDCDDTDIAILPGADEYCDGIDTDCSGTLDDDYALDASTWYADVDSDGYGEAASTVTACAAPSGYVADSTDCDDTDATINPAGTESHEWGDQDCDGLDEVGLEWANGVVYGNTGDAANLPGFMDLDADGVPEWLVGAPQANTDTGKVCVFSDYIGPGQNILDADFCYFGVDTDDRLAGNWDIGDTNGDGVPDLAIDAPWANPNGSNSGAVYFFESPFTLKTDRYMASGQYDGRYYGSGSGQEVGCAAQAAGDVDGDGYDDVFLNTHAYGSAYNHTIYLVYGPFTGTDAVLGTTSDIVITSNSGSTSAQVWQPCDITGDGTPEYVFSEDGYASYTGRVYLVPAADMTADFQLGTPGSWIDGDVAGHNFGASAHCAGDLDNDGYGDLWIGTTQDCIYLIPGRATLPAGSLGTLTDNAVLSVCMSGSPGKFAAGRSFLTSADFNGDGHADLALADAEGGTSVYGTVSVFAGPFDLTPGTMTTIDAWTEADVVFYGVSLGDYVSSNITSADVDLDGYYDLAIGAGNVGGDWSGASYLILGSPDFFPSSP